LASYGYWTGWVFGMGVFALTFGSLIQAQFFSDATWSIALGSADVGLGHVIGLGALVLSTILNARGIEFTIGLNKILGGVALLMIVVLVIGPWLTGDFHASGLTYGLNAEGLDWGGWRVALVFLFLFGWTVDGTEVCATIAPEYRDPQRDVSKALMASAGLTLVVAVLVPSAWAERWATRRSRRTRTAPTSRSSTKSSAPSARGHAHPGRHHADDRERGERELRTCALRHRG